MKNPYLFGFLPLITILLFSMTFGLFAVNESLVLFKNIGIYAAMSEFLSDVELRIFLFICFVVLFFMIFSAIKLVGESVHTVGMLFFAKVNEENPPQESKVLYSILLIGAAISVVGINSFPLLIIIAVSTLVIYFIATMVRLTEYLGFGSVIGLLVFEFAMWTLLVVTLAYVLVKLYNSLLSSLPFN